MGLPFGRYELIKRIAAGGMGEVFLARQLGLQGFEKLLVIKVMLRHLADNEEFVNMFLDEGRLAGRLSHPNIAQMFDLGQVERPEGTLLYMVMEYVHGEDVLRLSRTAKKKNKPLPIELAVRIASDAAAGLHYAHQLHDAQGNPLKIVHRDVAPQNLLVSFEGTVKVIDFGVAYAAGRATQTVVGALKGKFAYMSPEQAAGGLAHAVDHRSDIFSLGIVLYELCTGVLLFRRESDALTLAAAKDCKIPLPTSHNAMIEPALEAILMKALAKEPEDRYEDAQSFRMALDDWLLQSKQNGSTFHLAAFMRDVYADRLERERSGGGPGANSDFVLPPTPSAPSSKMTSRPPLLSLQTPSPSRPLLQPMSLLADAEFESVSLDSVAASPRNRRMIFGGVGLGVGLLLLAVLFFNGRSRPMVEVPSLSVKSRPSGAQVFLDGRIIGRTPLTAFPLPSGKLVNVELTLDGYITAREEVSPVGNQRLDLTLDPLPRPTVVPPPTPPVVAAPAPARPKNQPIPAVPEVTLSLDSRPSGATVVLDGTVLGITPFSIQRPRSDRTLALQFRMGGYKAITRLVEASWDQDVRVELTRVVAARESRHPPPQQQPQPAEPPPSPGPSTSSNEAEPASASSPIIRSVEEGKLRSIDEGKPLIRTIDSNKKKPVTRSIDPD